MIETNTIYGYALRDVNTGSYPYRENNEFIFPPGMKRILIEETYKPLKGLSSEINTINNKKQDLIRSMLSKQTPLNSNKTSTATKEKQLKGDVNTTSANIELLKEEVNEEEQRLLNREIPLPEKAVEVEVIEDDDDRNEDGNNFLQIANSHWNTAKKWFAVLFVIVLLESFFGLALWDSLRDQKSIVQVALRIAASAALVVTLHLAERKYKANKAKVFGGYIIFGILSLIVLLIGSLFIGYFFPEYLENGAISSDVFDLSGTDTIQTINPQNSLAGFFLRYDFMIGILSVIIYMLISFLDKSKKVEIDDNENSSGEENPVSSTHIATAHLEHLYITLANEERKLLKLQNKLKKIEIEPSELLEDVHLFLKNTKTEIENIDARIIEIKNIVDNYFIEIELQLDQYKVDFIDIFKSKPAYQFVQLEWPKRNDIKKYYNIN